jgi:uncharacterized protein (UPF0332 family)
MRPETAQFLDNARKMLERGRLMLTVPLYEDAGRAAYLACFHSAQALIFEREQRILKTHRGVQSEFHRLTQKESAVDAELRGFLSRAYSFKTIADYDLGSSVATTEADARLGIETAARFVERLAWIIENPPRLDADE